MKLTVLGTCAAYPGPGRAATGYLVRHDGFNLVVDLGNGALANLQREIAFTEVDGILVSHSHPDHCVDLYALFIARMFHTERLPALPLFTAQGVFDRFSKLGNETDEMRRSFAVRELEPGESFDMGPFRIETRPMTHWVPALGYRLQADGRTLAYTGDTGPTEEILPLGHEADLLVSEASWIDGQEVGRDPFHLTARQAAEHASRAEVRSLMLSHLWPTNDRRVCRDQASERFDGELALGDEGMTVEVGA